MDRQNEGIEDSTEVRMILLDMRGLLPREEWGIRLAVIQTEDVAFAVPFFTRSPHKSSRFDARGRSQTPIELEEFRLKVLKTDGFETVLFKMNKN